MKHYKHLSTFLIIAVFFSLLYGFLSLLVTQYYVPIIVLYVKISVLMTFFCLSNFDLFYIFSKGDECLYNSDWSLFFQLFFYLTTFVAYEFLFMVIVVSSVNAVFSTDIVYLDPLLSIIGMCFASLSYPMFCDFLARLFKEESQTFSEELVI